MDSYGFTLKCYNKTIVYTGDTCTLDPFKKYLDNVDEFYVDISKNGGVHLGIEDVFDDLKKIKNNGVRVFLMHIDDRNYVKKMIGGEFELI